MKKLVVHTENCIGCGACVGIDNKHFDFNEEGFSYVISQEDLDSPAVMEAIESCPVPEFDSFSIKFLASLDKI